MCVDTALGRCVVNPGTSRLNPPPVVTEPPPVPGQVVQLPPPAGSAAGGPGAYVCQLVGLDNLHDNNADNNYLGVVTNKLTD